MKRCEAMIQILRKIKHKSAGFAKSLILCKSNINSKLFAGFTPRCEFLWNAGSSGELIECTNGLNSGKEIVFTADKICAHVFDLLGSGDKWLGEEICWNKDFKTGYIWKNKFYMFHKLINNKNSADVKLPWELSRFQHLPSLGKAYWLTGDEKYALEFKNEAEHWNKKNPAGMSINWTCSMEIAIRAVNWISAYGFFCGSRSIPDNFWCDYYRSLYLHGSFIFNNLENTGRNHGNHYISDLIGLVWLGIFFSGLEKQTGPKILFHAGEWLKFGVQELEKEILVQVNNDGTYYEASTNYHRLATEMLLYTAIFCSINRIEYSEAFKDRLKKMLEFIPDITKPSGLAPVIGDADDGRLLITAGYANWIRNDYRYLTAIGRKYFSNDHDQACTSIGSKAYRDGGYYIMRSARTYCLVRCGELACRGSGGHSHNDQLSFELNVDGEDFFIDPGNYTYSSDYRLRNLFRSTRVHNTLSFNGIEQNDFKEKKLFVMPEQTFSECSEFTGSLFRGRHLGYAGKLGLVHERTISINDDVIEVKDDLQPEKTYNRAALEYMINYTLDTGVDILLQDSCVILKKKDAVIRMNYSGVLSIEDCIIARRYGFLEKSSRLVIKRTIDEGSHNLTVFRF